MRQFSGAAVVALLFFSFAQAFPPPEGFVSIFNGSDFAGWAGDLSHYEVKNGCIVCKPGKGGVVFTTRQYANFVARVDYRLPPGGNNGLAIRYPGKGTASVDAMCEIQILDDTHPKYNKLDPRQFNGSSYGIIAAKNGSGKPVGEWNTMEVTAKGSTLKVVLNGSTILEGDVATVREFMRKEPPKGIKNSTGHFGFCGHNDPVEFRNVYIKEIP
jgi:hypothetical protein